MIDPKALFTLVDRQYGGQPDQRAAVRREVEMVNEALDRLQGMRPGDPAARATHDGAAYLTCDVEQVAGTKDGWPYAVRVVLGRERRRLLGEGGPPTWTPL